MSAWRVEVTRGGIVESLHLASVAVVADDGSPTGHLEIGGGDIDQPVFLRSAAKPFQAIGSWRLGLERLGVAPGSRHLAIMAASHGGTPEQVATVRELLDLAGVDAGCLDCGVHEPLSAAGRAALAGQPASSAHANCSGKHAGMLAACAAQGWPLVGYRQPDHPLQTHLLAVFAELMGVAIGDVPVGVDGCGVPVWAISLRRAALACARLLAPELAPVGQAMRNHPTLVGAPEGFNVRLMQAMPEVVAKNGAEGVFCLGLPERRLGLALKVHDGSHRGVPPLVLALLTELGLTLPDALAEFIEPVITNLHGETAGRVRARRAGDARG